MIPALLKKLLQKIYSFQTNTTSHFSQLSHWNLITRRQCCNSNLTGYYNTVRSIVDQCNCFQVFYIYTNISNVTNLCYLIRFPPHQYLTSLLITDFHPSLVICLLKSMIKELEFLQTVLKINHSTQDYYSRNTCDKIKPASSTTETLLTTS